jgi:transposase
MIYAPTARPSARCPRCQRSSSRVHSRSLRSPRDLPVGNQRVPRRWQVRRGVCDQPAWPQRTCAERLSHLVPVPARRTARLPQARAALGCARGGRGGARGARRLHVRTSRRTLLRVVCRTALPPRPTPRVLGVAEVALRQGRVSGTSRVDLDQRRPGAVLPGRAAQALAAWRRAHPGVEVVTRDRSPAYPRGAPAGAPAASPGAERWPRLTNLRAALERGLDRAHPHVRLLAMALPVGLRATASPQVVPVRPRRRSASEDGARAARRARRQACDEAVRTRDAQGKSRRPSAAALPLSRGLGRRLVQADALPERAPPRRRASQLARCAAYLQERWPAGARNTLALWRMLHHPGSTGAGPTGRRWVQQRRREPAPRTHPA